MQYIKQTASGLSPGDVSDYVNTPEGGLLVVLEKREELDAAQFEKARTFLEERELNEQRPDRFLRMAAGTAPRRRRRGSEAGNETGLTWLAGDLPMMLKPASLTPGRSGA